jgi:hypothetical protein
MSVMPRIFLKSSSSAITPNIKNTIREACTERGTMMAKTAERIA